MMLARDFARWIGFDPKAMEGAGWDYVPRYEDSELAAVAAVRGFEIHFAVNPTWRRKLITRRRIREFLGPLLADKGFLTTRVMYEDCDSPMFLTRLGFQYTGASFVDGEPFVLHYMLSALPYGKET